MGLRKTWLHAMANPVSSTYTVQHINSQAVFMHNLSFGQESIQRVHYPWPYFQYLSGRSQDREPLCIETLILNFCRLLEFQSGSLVN